MESIDTNKTEVSAPTDAERMHTLNRFVSTLAGAYRAFTIYKHDNKALDDIIKNLVRRFKNVAEHHKTLKLGVTNFSLTFDGSPVGFQKITIHLASLARRLGFKEIVLKFPIQSSNFFQLMLILSGKDSDEIKLNKLAPFFEEGEDRPIVIIPLMRNSAVLKMEDALILKRLAPLTVPKSQGGSGFVEALTSSQVHNFPDFLTWTSIEAEMLPQGIRALVRSLCDATREGFFPADRFLRVFPIPKNIQTELVQSLSTASVPRPRRKTPLGQRFLPAQRNGEGKKTDWLTQIHGFSGDEIQERLRSHLVEESAQLQNIELSRALLKDGGSNFEMGLRLLNRILESNNTFAIQEKALKLGVAVWVQAHQIVRNAKFISLVSALRKNLSAPHNMTLILDPVRSVEMGCEKFEQMSRFILSLGEMGLPAIISALEVEEERAMRRKLIQIITDLIKEQGADYLLEPLSHAPTYLLRNLIMILGNIKFEDAAEAITAYVQHDERIVRIEAVRALCSIGDDVATRALYHAAPYVRDHECAQMIGTYFAARKDTSVAPGFIQVARNPKISFALKKAIYIVIWTLGGPQAKQFFLSQKKESSILGRFNSEDRELQMMIKNFLSQME